MDPQSVDLRDRVGLAGPQQAAGHTVGDQGEADRHRHAPS